MFRDNYQKEMKDISPDPTVMESILRRLENGNKVKMKKNRTVILWRSGMAAAACIALVLAVMIPREKRTIKAAVSAKLNAAVSYDEIYEKIEPLCNTQINYSAEYGLETQYSTGTNTLTKGEIASTGSAAAGGSAAPNGNSDAATQNGTAIMEDDACCDETVNEHSVTNTQVDGVDEADIVKTDGKYIYSLFDNKVRIVRADSGKTEFIQTITLPASGITDSREMYLTDDRLIVLLSDYGRTDSKNYTRIIILDVTDPKQAKQIGSCRQSGGYRSSRMVGSHLYVISNYYLYPDNVKKDEPETYIPMVASGSSEETVAPSCIRMYDGDVLSAVYLTACAYDVADASMTGTQSVLGGADEMYCSTGNMITASSRGIGQSSGTDSTVISRFTLNDGAIEYKTAGKIKGQLVNQFAIDESNGYFRFVTTVNSVDETIHPATGSDTADKLTDSVSTVISAKTGTSASLYILDGNLKQTGAIENLADGERVYSVRFMGNTAYFVTFRQTDPLFSADLSDPENPKIIGQLKIPGFSSYLYPYGDGKLLGMGMDADTVTGRTNCVKLSMFNISDPSNVTESSKTLLENATYSEALYNHKACLVSKEKNLIGLPVYSDKGLVYRLYTYNDSFAEITSITADTANDFARGLFIGDVFYLVTDRSVKAYSLADMHLLSSLNLS